VKEGEWRRHLVNLHRSQEERRDQYNLLRACGFAVSWARQMRDWRMSKIDRLLADRPELKKIMEEGGSYKRDGFTDQGRDP